MVGCFNDIPSVKILPSLFIFTNLTYLFTNNFLFMQLFIYTFISLFILFILSFIYLFIASYRCNGKKKG